MCPDKYVIFSDPQKCKGIPNTDYGCCTRDNRCGVGMGDCDDDSHCLPGLKCGQDNCWLDFRIQNGFNWDFQADCCYGKAHTHTLPIYIYIYTHILLYL